MDLEERIMELSRYGYACGQILAILLLDTIGEENPALVRCFQGLNGGIGSSGGANHQKPKNEDGTYKFEVGITSIPQIDPSNPKVISQGPSLCIFDKDIHSNKGAAI